jgi:hypothetical protein
LIITIGPFALPFFLSAPTRLSPWSLPTLRLSNWT